MALGKLGKYERVDVLGHGVSGIVYLAWDTLLKKQVALKEIDLQAADVQRFLEEARVMDRLHHPNIVRVNGVDMIDGRVIIDMEYVKGQNLQELLRAEGRLPVERALDIAIQTLDALDYAHRMRTVHRDIKPANILLRRDGQVKLVDFGLAEILATNSYAGGAGTYAYMAPEDFEEEHHSDHQSDIWAVGVTLYEMLMGTRPFQVARPKDPFAWRRVLLNDPPTPLSFDGRGSGAEGDDPPSVLIPPQWEDLQAVLDRALAKDKRDRYATAGEFRDDLIAIRDRRSPAHVRAVVAGQADKTIPRFDLPIPIRNGGAEQARGQTVAVTAAPPPRTEEAAKPQASPRRRFPGLMRRKEIPPARVTVEPDAIHFGAVRKGDERAAKVTVRIEGGEGRMTGRVAAVPNWVTVSPTRIRRRKQTLLLTAHSERVWQTGDYEDTVHVETSGGDVRIPVSLRVLKPRPRFSEVALWLVPLFFAVLLPALTVAWGAQSPAARHLVPSAALGSGLLAAMLLMVVFAADLGFSEKMAGGVLLAVMTMVLGVTVGVSVRSSDTEGLSSLLATGVPIGILLVLQAASRRHWQTWACAIVVLSLLTAGTFAGVLSGRL